MKKNKALLFIALSAVTFPLFLVFFYSQLPESVPMQFSLPGKVNWSLPLNVALFAFVAFFVVFVGQVYFRFRKDESYPIKDCIFAILMPLFFIAFLVIAIIIT